MEEYKYNAWKAKANGEPIMGTDKTYIGVSKRAVLKHLAFEEKVPYENSGTIVRCNNGDMWCVSKIN
jgi:hypothetical protein